MIKIYLNFKIVLNNISIIKSTVKMIPINPLNISMKTILNSLFIDGRK